MKRLLCMVLLICVSVPATAQDVADAELAENAALRYWMAFLYIPTQEGWQESLGDWDEMEIEQARAMLGPGGDGGTALATFHWAAQLDRCAWAIDHDAGPYALLPHLGPSRTLARYAMLRARVRLHDGDAAGAAQDILAVAKLGRAFDSDRLLISSLVGTSIEWMALLFTAEHLSRFDDATLAQLAAGLAALPDRPALSQIIRGERELFLGWLERTLRQAKADGVVASGLDDLAAGLGLADADPGPGQMDYDQWLAWVDEAEDAYDEAGRVADLPYDAYREAIGELEAGFENTDNQVIALFFPSVAAVRHSTDLARARRAMLNAMLAIRLDGDADNLADHPAMQDPFGQGTFELVIQRDDATGELVYGLRCAMLDREGRPVELHTDAPLGVAQP